MNSDTYNVPTGLYVLLAMYVVFLIVCIWADIRIIRRAGYSGWWILIGLVPVVNVVMFLVFAFKEWPIQRELALLRAQLSGDGGYGYGQPPAGYGYPPTGYPPPGPSNHW